MSNIFMSTSLKTLLLLMSGSMQLHTYNNFCLRLHFKSLVILTELHVYIKK